MANTPTVQYRLARAGDAPAIATLHAESWRVAYRGMLPDAFLDNDVFDDRAALWAARFDASREQPATVTVLAEIDGVLAGFAHSILNADPEHGTLLDNLHVHRDMHRLGIGTRLMAETAAWLEQRGNKEGLYLWVLEGNERARSFYEVLGGAITGRDVSPEGGSNAPSLRCSWPDLGALSRLLAEGSPRLV